MKKFVFLHFLFIWITLYLHGDIIYLKNGQKINGKITKQDKEFYYINLRVGPSKIPKNKVNKVQIEEQKLSKSQLFLLKIEESRNKSELQKAVNWGVKNNLDTNILVSLKNIQSQDKDKELKDAAKALSVSIIIRQIAKIKTNHKEKKHSQAIDYLFKLKNIITYQPSYLLMLETLEKEIFNFILSEKDTILIINKSLMNLPSYNKQARVKGKRSKRKKKDQKGETDPFQEFFNSYENFLPIFSDTKKQLKDLISFSRYIEKNNYHNLASKNIYQKKEIDASRKDIKLFRSIVAENDKIYKARKSCKNYMFFLKKLNKEWERKKTSVEKESLFWSNKGYEKKYGKWVKKEETKDSVIKQEENEQTDKEKPIKKKEIVKLEKSKQLTEAEIEKNIQTIEEEILKRNRKVIKSIKTSKINKTNSKELTVINENNAASSHKSKDIITKLTNIINKKVGNSNNLIYVLAGLIGIFILIKRK